MIYALSTGELSALLYLHGKECSPLSPFYDGAKELEKPNRLEEKASGLAAMGLCRKTTANPILTDTGHLLADVLAIPENVTSAERKNTTDPAVNILNRGGLFCLHQRFSGKHLHVIHPFLTRELTIRWLNENYLNGWSPTEEGKEKTSLLLSYDAWICFLISQFLFMRRAFRNCPVQEDFTVNDLKDRSTLSYLNTSLTALGTKRYAGAVQYLFQEENTEALAEAIRQLCEKGVWEILPERTEDGEQKFRYAKETIRILDNDRLTDTMLLTAYRNEMPPCRLLLSLRTNGITALMDDGEHVHLTFSPQLDWALYLD